MYTLEQVDHEKPDASPSFDTCLLQIITGMDVKLEIPRGYQILSSSRLLISILAKHEK